MLKGAYKLNSCCGLIEFKFNPIIKLFKYSFGNQFMDFSFYVI